MTPPRCDISIADPDPTRDTEQAGRRPVLIVSVDRFNAGGSGLVLAMPLTSRRRSMPYPVKLLPPEGGLTVPSAILCEALRSIPRQRLVTRLGGITPPTQALGDDRLRLLLGL